ncbi:putative quinol monooxygenase [Xenorhabdus sp. SGI246]|uniref:putative quinol monooxygenase n=1 Tax=Xenorhabdus sp. SGI246 TaxID=3158263 RepID=UPI00349FBC8A
MLIHAYHQLPIILLYLWRKLSSIFFHLSIIQQLFVFEHRINIKELKILQEKTLSEPGCEIFFIQQSNKTPNTFIMWEKFISQEALKQHFEYDHTKNYLSLDLTEVVQVFTADTI